MTRAMVREQVLHILEQVAAGKLTADAAERQISAAGFEDLGHTRLDTDRQHRRGVAEAVFCQGKTPEQVVTIVGKLMDCGQTVLCTRVAPEAAALVTAQFPQVQYSPVARLLQRKAAVPVAMGIGHIAVVTAGTTDIPVAEEAALCAEVWGNEVQRIFDVGVAGIHRLMAVRGELERASVIIVAAGMEGALPSVVAGLVRTPVIAVPTSVGYGASFGGVAALLGMLNSCSGGLAVVNIDNGFGAALLAHMIVHPHQAGAAQ